MSFYLGKIKLPILEASVRIGKNREYENIPILNGETITIMGKKGLTQISYSSMFPKQWGSYCDVSENQLKEPNKYKKLLEEMRDNENYFLVRINELKYNEYCKITNVNFEIENGMGDITYTLELEQYNKLNISKTIYVPPITMPTTIIAQDTVINDISLNGAPREEKTVEAQYYVVKKGDCVYSIARKFNIKPIDLYNDNKKIIGNDWNLIYPGQKFYIRGTKQSQDYKIVKLKNGRKVIVNHR